MPDSCRVTGKKWQQHRANGKDDTIDSDWNAVRMSLIFQQNCTVQLVYSERVQTTK